MVSGPGTLKGEDGESLYHFGVIGSDTGCGQSTSGVTHQMDSLQTQRLHKPVNMLSDCQHGVVSVPEGIIGMTLTELVYGIDMEV